MGNLEIMTSKILEDSNKKAEEILNSAKEEENKILIEGREKALLKKEEIIKKAIIEAKSKEERIISNANLTVRNNKLRAKQQIVEKVFNRAKEELENMPIENQMSFIKNTITTLPIDGDEEIILSKDLKEDLKDNLIKDINEQLKAVGKRGSITVSKIKRDIKGGFILYKEGIELNCTYEALILSLKDEMESEVIKALFD